MTVSIVYQRKNSLKKLGDQEGAYVSPWRGVARKASPTGSATQWPPAQKVLLEGQPVGQLPFIHSPPGLDAGWRRGPGAARRGWAPFKECNVVTHNKKCTFRLRPVVGTELQNPLELPK